MKKIIVLLMFLMVALSVSAISAANDADNFNDNGVLVVEHDTLIVENNNPAMDVDNMVNVADDSSGVVNIPLPHEDPVNISDEEGVSSIPASDVFWNNSTIGDDLNNVSSGVVNIPLPHVDSVNISDEEGVSSIPADVFLRGSIISSKVLGDFNNAFSGVVNIPLPHVDSVNISDEEGVSSIPASGFHP